MTPPTGKGITATMVTSSRLTTRVLASGSDNGTPILFLHGNLSSATWWEGTMAAIPQQFRAIAPDLRGFGDSDPAVKVDARRGLLDFVDDVIALLEHLNIEESHVVGMSLGGSILWGMMTEIPDRLLSVTLVAPGSPYGMGGTKGPEGTLCAPDCAGSGGGLISKKMVQLLRTGDRTMNHPFSPRSALRNMVFRPPFIADREEELLTSMGQTHFGDQDYPGDSIQSPYWPYFSPGIWGATNAISPKYAGDNAQLFESRPKARVLWIRGADDLAVSDSSLSDPGRLGQMGLISGWPGVDGYPPQPVLLQTRTVLMKYSESGGSYREMVIPECGHAPFIEKPGVANAALSKHLLGR